MNAYTPVLTQYHPTPPQGQGFQPHRLPDAHDHAGFKAWCVRGESSNGWTTLMYFRVPEEHSQSFPSWASAQGYADAWECGFSAARSCPHCGREICDTTGECRWSDCPSNIRKCAECGGHYNLNAGCICRR